LSVVLQNDEEIKLTVVVAVTVVVVAADDDKCSFKCPEYYMFMCFNTIRYLTRNSILFFQRQWFVDSNRKVPREALGEHH